MSTVTANDSPDFAAPVSKPTGIAALRLWPAAVLVISFWAFLEANYATELSAQSRFISRMIAHLIALLAFLGWWLSRSKIAWRDRLLAVVVPIVCGAIVLQFADKTINWFAI